MDELLKHLTDIELIIMRAKLREHMFPQDTDFLLANFEIKSNASLHEYSSQGHSLHSSWIPA